MRYMWKRIYENNSNKKLLHQLKKDRYTPVTARVQQDINVRPIPRLACMWVPAFQYYCDDKSEVLGWYRLAGGHQGNNRHPIWRIKELHLQRLLKECFNNSHSIHCVSIQSKSSDNDILQYLRIVGNHSSSLLHPLICLSTETLQWIQAKVWLVLLESIDTDNTCVHLFPIENVLFETDITQALRW